VQILRSEFPHDASATAIAGASAQLVFTLSDCGDSDPAQVITAGDSAATWWRTQVGLGTRPRAGPTFHRLDRWGASDSGWSELRAASLMAGFTADEGGSVNVVYQFSSASAATRRAQPITPSALSIRTPNVADR
jgi:hypothetical protein